jgi:hypothetical protein
MNIETVLIATVGAGILWFLKDSILNWALGRKTVKLSKDVKEQKEVADEAVTRANVSRESFLERLRKYRAGQSIDD